MTSVAVEKIDGTKKRLLEAMEGLVVERGFDAVSVRDITGVAKANVAAVNYHFGSREGLVQAVVEQRLRPLVMLRQEQLASATTTTDIEHLLQLWLMPIVTIQQVLGEEEIRYCRVMGRCLEMAHSLPTAPVVQELHKVDDAFLTQMQRIFPSSEASTVAWEFHCCRGSLMYFLVYGHQMMSDVSLKAHIDLLNETGFGVRKTAHSSPQVTKIEIISPAASETVKPKSLDSMFEEEEAASPPQDDGYDGKFLF
jgi:AcrR family transcriptional regulator